MALTVKVRKRTPQQPTLELGDIAYLTERNEKGEWFPGSKLPLPEKALRPAKTLPVIQDGNPFWNPYRDGVTQSLINLWRECPRKAHWKYIKGFSGAKYNPAMELGSMFHLILDKIYTAMMDIKDIRLPLDIVNESLNEFYTETTADSDIDIKKFQAMYSACVPLLHAYFKFWKKEDTIAKIIGVEKEFAFAYTMRNGRQIPLRGKIDAIHSVTARIDKNGDIWLFETKTKDGVDNQGNHSAHLVLETMEYNLQVILYCEAIKSMYGKYPKGVIYNLVKRPGQEFKESFNRKPENLQQFSERVKADIEAKTNYNKKQSAYFLRYSVLLSSQKIQAFMQQDFDSVIEPLVEWSEVGLGYRDYKACYKFRKPCEYLGLCNGTKDASDFEVRDTIFPELSEMEDE